MSKISFEALGDGCFGIDIELDEVEFQQKSHPLRFVEIAASVFEERTANVASALGKLICYSFSSQIKNARIIGFPTSPMDHLESLTVLNSMSRQPLYQPFLSSEPAWPLLAQVRSEKELDDLELMGIVGHFQSLRSISLTLRNVSNLTLQNLSQHNNFLQSIDLTIWSGNLSLQSEIFSLI